MSSGLLMHALQSCPALGQEFRTRLIRLLIVPVLGTSSSIASEHAAHPSSSHAGRVPSWLLASTTDTFVCTCLVCEQSKMRFYEADVEIYIFEGV